MTNLGKTILTKANGEVKVLENKFHAFMTAHPIASFVVGLVAGFVVAQLVR